MSDTESPDEPNELLQLTADIVSAYVSNNEVSAGELQQLLHDVYGTLGALDAAEDEADRPFGPAVPIEDSVTDDYIICLEDGKQLKMLKRYLRTHFGLSPEEYRRKWGLPADYPMVAPNYAAQRAEFAKQSGLGQSTERRSSGRGRRKGD